MKNDKTNARLAKFSEDFRRETKARILGFKPYVERLPAVLDDDTLLAVHDILWNRAGIQHKASALLEDEGHPRASKTAVTQATTYALACAEVRNLLGDRIYFDEKKDRWSLVKYRRIVWVRKKR